MSESRLVAAALLLLSVAGVAVAAERPVAVSPGDVSKMALIEHRCPTFSWGEVEEATAYELVVYRVGEDGQEAKPVLRQRLPGSANVWTPDLDRCLERGGRYAWSVRAANRDGVSDWPTPHLFEVATRLSRTDLEAAVDLLLSHISSAGDTVSARDEILETLAATRDEMAHGDTSRPLPAAVGPTQMTVDGGVVATSFTGDGSTLTNLDPTKLSPGTAGISISGSAASAVSATSATTATTANSATTATSLAADGTNCPVGQFPAGVDDAGNAQDCGYAPGAMNQSGRIDFEILTAESLSFEETFSPSFASPPTLQLTPLFPLGGVAAALASLSESAFNGTLLNDGSSRVVDELYSVGSHTSLAVVNGKPAISYYDETNNDLMYVQATDAEGIAWNDPVAVDAPAGTSPDVGLYTSLAVVNGKPAISYFDLTYVELKYVQATDADGTAWGTPVEVDTTGGAYTSLAVVNGKPAISYLAAGNLSYVQASDANGTAWGTPVIADATSGLYISLAVVNGKPAISYHDSPNNDLSYVQATDADGTTWGTPTPVDAPAGSSPNVGWHTSLVVVNGKPAISYYDDTNNDLKYVQATDADGSAWGSPVPVDAPAGTSPDVGQYSSLTVVNGKPAISYSADGDLSYVQATDADGTAWDTPVGADAPPDSVGWYTSLAVVNGKPAISYYDATNDDLKYWSPVSAAVLWTATEP